jgi:hypothetical protein
MVRSAVPVVGLLAVLIAICVTLSSTNAQNTLFQWASPTKASLYSVFMVSQDDGWAVGDEGTIIRWDGMKWSNETCPVTSKLNSVFMVNASDGWAVGYEGTIIHWDGANWTNMTFLGAQLASVFMISTNDGWAVGGGSILHWNGVTWNSVEGPGNMRPLRSVSFFDTNDGWAVGEAGTNIHWNGSQWSNVASPTENNLMSVFMINASDVWAVGNGAVIHWDGGWSNSTETNWDFNSVYMISGDNGWAVGNSWNTLHWDGTKWNVVVGPTIYHNLWSVSMVNSNDGWAVGENGTIVRWNGTQWIPELNQSLLICLFIATTLSTVIVAERIPKPHFAETTRQVRILLVKQLKAFCSKLR